MTTIEAILLGAFPFVALVSVGVVFYLIRDRFFSELEEDKKQRSK